MCRDRLIVLKFGGSVLLSEQSLRHAVTEIARWRADNWHVVAVVSALAGRTDVLLRQASDIAPKASPWTVAALLALGEHESAALLQSQCDAAELPSCVLTPGAIKLEAQGDPLDADPITLGVQSLQSALKTHGTTIVPGFVGISADGRHVTLGRGGSDLTALFLAHALSADRCRLIKDVDGLYTSDPAQSEPKPERYDTCTYADALQTDGSIIQPKAIRFAERHGLTFELGSLGCTNPTRIGAEVSTLTNSPESLESEFEYVA